MNKIYLLTKETDIGLTGFSACLFNSLEQKGCRRATSAVKQIPICTFCYHFVIDKIRMRVSVIGDIIGTHCISFELHFGYQTGEPSLLLSETGKVATTIAEYSTRLGRGPHLPNDCVRGAAQRARLRAQGKFWGSQNAFCTQT